jgi:hypothetical protein
MGEAYITRRGSNPLNFKVVGGTTEPTNPKENTIWVNTDVKITGYYFSPKEIYNMVEGDVWITMGNDSPVAFDALKKNGIRIDPFSAKQYISGAWVDKTAKSYQGGEWVDWIITLYENGVEKVPFEAYTSNVTEDSSYLIIHPASDNFGIWGTSSPIDLTGKKSVDASFYNMTSQSTFTYYEVKVMVAKSKITNSANAIAVKADTALTDGTVSLDISNLSGEYYVAVQFYHQSSGGKSASVRFTGVKLS